jgi:hypothetical protein
MDPIVINAVAFPEGNLWIAQCLEYDFVSCAKTKDDLPAALLRQVLGQIRVDLDNGHEPFFGFKPAPARYWRMFEQARLQSIPVDRKATLEQTAGRAAERSVETHVFPVAA